MSTNVMTQAPLQTKTYFSTTVEAAMDLARRELGPDAMLVNSRSSPEEVRHLGRYEVILATSPARESERPRSAPLRPGDFESALHLEEIKLQLASIRQTLGLAGGHAEKPTPTLDTAAIRRMLEANGVAPPLARDLIRGALRHVPDPSAREQFRRAVAAEMEGRLKVDPSLGREGAACRIVALVGPPGRGKTTTLVKLAVAFGLSARAPVRILSLDSFRIGAAEQMRSYAAILGVPFEAFDSVTALQRALSGPWGVGSNMNGLTLIDTSGYGPGDLDTAADLAAFLSAHPQLDTHLVLRADMKTADLISAVERYAHFGVSKLIFTGVDEAQNFGSLFSVAVESGTPVSFLCAGQRIPEDLESASGRAITALVLDRPQTRVSVAA